MDLLPTQEQQQIIDTAANFLAREFPVDPTLATGSGGERIGTAQLQQIAQLGWLGIGLPDEWNGVGYGLSEEALLFVELGRNLMPPSLLGSALGARLASAAGETDIATGILEGVDKVALATPIPGGKLQLGKTVSGEFLVYEAQNARYVLLVDESGAALLPLDTLNLLREETCIDPGVSLCRYTAQNSQSSAFATVSEENLFLRGALLTSALLLGIAEATLDRSVNYAKEREQFGQAIGAFQAIKHYCADMSVRCESVRAMLYHASITQQQDSAAGVFDTYSLKALAANCASSNAHAAVQIHGGMGFTQEMDIHLFVKRALILATLFGGERLHLQRLLAEPIPN